MKREPWNPLLKSFPESRKINSVSLGAETMFTRLLALCDDHSNYYGDPRLLLAYAYGQRLANGTASVRKCTRWRDELVTATLVDLYEVDGDEYLHIINCKKLLRSDIKEDIRFPKMPQVPVNKGLPESGPNPGRKRNTSGPSEDSHKRPIRNAKEREKGEPPTAHKQILSLSFPHGCSEKQRQATLQAVTQAERAGVPYAFLEAAITSPKADGPPWKRIDDAIEKAKKIVEAVNEACGRKRFSDLQNLVDVATAEGYDESGRLAGLPAKVCGFSLRKILERCGATIGAEAPASAPQPAAAESPDPG